MNLRTANRRPVNDGMNVLALKFSERGPEFPSALVDALMSGEVVFLCGTGISAPQLPDFKSLVDRTYVGLGVEMDPSEQRAYDAQRYEEVLGALGRRLADPEAMVRTVADLLVVPDNSKLDQHKTVLRLSRDLSNRVLVVTTNFDTLLERGLERPAATVRPLSFAGQALPAPGATGFAGIIHIHGRLEDRPFDLDATPLVLTSSDYGDAYMRSGWASRFLFDLARCKTIVLIGYSAGDAPVRYFLNVLEADRARFPDLRQIYAFDAYECDPGEAEAAWGTVAVTPLVYCKVNQTTGDHDHSSLWNDLHQLADIVERPKRSREARARAILSGDSSTLNDQQLRELTWLFTGRKDLWAVAIVAVADPKWFKILDDNKLWSSVDACRVIAAWIARDFENQQRFETAVEWHTVLDRDFFIHLDRLLRQVPPASPFWLTAWRMLLTVGMGRHYGQLELYGNAVALKQKLQSGLILDQEIARSVEMLTPALIARRPFRVREDEDGTRAKGNLAEPRLSDLVWFDLEVGDEHGATEIVGALDALVDHAPRILELGSAVLRTALQQLVDLGRIDDEHDTNDFMVPSIEDHAQNEHRNGVVFLVRAIANAFPKAMAKDRESARAQYAQWATWPGRVGARLSLHVVRDVADFTADEALQVLLDLNDASFWMIRREIALVLRDRAAEASPALREAVEVRIRTSGNAHYGKYPLEEGQVDWRSHARDSAVWLRLKMLDAAEVLSVAGHAELNAIVLRRPYLDREVEDSDFFGSYSYGVRSVAGDSAPITEADPDDRLKVAAELRQSPDIDRQLGWQAYCRADPKGAFESLANAELTAANIALWDDLLAALAIRDSDKDDPLRDAIASDAMAHLIGLEAEALRPIATSAIDVLLFRPRRQIANLENWCDRLWEAVRLDDQAIDFETSLYETASNRAAGRLTRILLAELDRTHRQNGPDGEQQRSRLARIADDDSSAGTLARAVLTSDAAFLLLADTPLVEDILLPRIAQENAEARAMRSILVTFANITPEVTKVARDAILRGVVDVLPGSGFAPKIASGILRPALASIRGDNPGRWGISEADVAWALREASLKIRAGTLNVLAQWTNTYEEGGEAAWETMVSPFFDRIWPKELRFVDEGLNRDLMALAVGADTKFPKALATLRPYFRPFSGGRSDIFPIVRSRAPDAFPGEVLELLWLLFGPAGDCGYDMADLLDRLLAADPAIEVDRRFQSLEQRTIRFR
mgnify:CR=1 FL=1